MTNLEMNQMKLEMLQYMSQLAEAQEQLEAKLEAQEANLERWKQLVLEHDGKLMGEPNYTGDNDLDRLDRLDIRTENLVKCWDLVLEKLPEMETKMQRLEKQVGYAIRKLYVAMESDPDNIWLKKIFDAVQDLDSKLN